MKKKIQKKTREREIIMIIKLLKLNKIPVSTANRT